DPRLVDRLAAYIDQHRVPASAYEFAMLYGIQRPLQQRLVHSGRSLRVLIAYGEYWFPWYMRRLAERPANVWFVIRNLVSRVWPVPNSVRPRADSPGSAVCASCMDALRAERALSGRVITIGPPP